MALKIRLLPRLGYRVIQVPCGGDKDVQHMIDFISKNLFCVLLKA